MLIDAGAACSPDWRDRPAEHSGGKLPHMQEGPSGVAPAAPCEQPPDRRQAAAGPAATRGLRRTQRGDSPATGPLLAVRRSPAAGPGRATVGLQLLRGVAGAQFPILER